jgi:1,2-diacylglycerol-3-alpha-glucose alpha-1,2-galactosyltransferase
MGDMRGAVKARGVLDFAEKMYTITEYDKMRRPVVNLVSETVDGCKGHGVHTAFAQTEVALRRAGVDVRVNASERCDIVHIETMGLFSLHQLLRARERAVVTAHIVPESLIGSFILAAIWLPIGAAYMRAFYSLADEILAVSPEVSEGLRRMKLEVPVRVVPNGVDVERFRSNPGWREEMRTRLGIPQNSFVAMCAGQIQPRKGVDAFIETARAMPDVSFVWVGGMPFRRLTNRYRHMVDAVAHAPANCHFVGDVDFAEMPRWYSSADCLFFPSVQETFGLAIVEAAAAGLPLVLREIETYGPLFGDSYLGGDEHTFAQLIGSLRDDEALWSQYSQLSLSLASRFDTPRLAEELLDVYEEVLARSECERARAARRLRPVLQWTFGGGRSGRR